MKGYVNIPETIYVTMCRECGARPIIAPAGDLGYVVKCPMNDEHYQTLPGLIDIESWNLHNRNQHGNDFNHGSLSQAHP
jgi:hypothetical protein